MTIFQLETYFAQKIAQLPNDTSINGALIIIETSDTKVMAVAVGDLDVVHALSKAVDIVSNAVDLAGAEIDASD
jgi:hypothetical protein